MTKEEFLIGVRKVFVNTLKRRGVYPEFRKYYTRHVEAINNMFIDKMPIFYFRFEDINNRFCTCDGIPNKFIEEYARTLSHAVISFPWNTAKYGTSFWGEIHDHVVDECYYYIKKNFKNVKL